MRAIVLPVVAVLVACAPGDGAPATEGGVGAAGAAADTTAVDSTAVDSAAADSAPVDSAPDVTVRTTSAAVRGDSIVRNSMLRGDSSIGRDSAYGPMYTIDSTGKLVRIRRP